MTLVDDRNEEQRLTLTLAVVGTDKYLSGWGMTEGGPSYAGWACTAETVDDVQRRIMDRSDMKRVRIVNLNGYRPSGKGHCHIYVAAENR